MFNKYTSIYYYYNVFNKYTSIYKSVNINNNYYNVFNKYTSIYNSESILIIIIIMCSISTQVYIIVSQY